MQPSKKRCKIKSRASTPASTASSFALSSSSSSSLTIIPTLKELQGSGDTMLSSCDYGLQCAMKYYGYTYTMNSSKRSP